ncbi:MAG: hypothetical protein EZS28_035632, partial [Streblomastix strix]
TALLRKSRMFKPF